LGLPILAIGALDFDIPSEDVLKYPKLAYSTGRLGEMLNLKNMAKWCIFAFVQGLILFLVAIRFISGSTNVFASNDGLLTFDIYGTGLNQHSTATGLGVFAEGFLIYSVAVVAMQYKVVAMCCTPNYIFWFLWVISFMGYVFFTYLYGLSPSLDWYNTVPLAFSQSEFWLALLLIPIILSISDFCFDKIWTYFDPSSRDLLINLLSNDANSVQQRPSNNGIIGVALGPISESADRDETLKQNDIL
jgi:magnesium-transporting ATPase (P-type)